MGSTVLLIQRGIDTQQKLDTIEYGLRAQKALGTRNGRARPGVWGSRWVPEYERSALIAQMQLAAEAIGVECDAALRFNLLQAKRAARLERDEVKRAVKEMGGVRQVRLAMAA